MNLPALKNPEWFLPMEPYEFQGDAYNKTVDYIRKEIDPGFIYASVSAGKSLMMAMICKREQMMAEQRNKPQLRILCMARTGELVEQNAEQMWEIGVRNSIFSASVGLKSTKYPVIVGSEGSVCRALQTQLKNSIFDIILWDECLTGDTLIDTENGKIKISKLTTKTKIFCICEITGKIYLDYPIRVFSNGIRNVSHIHMLEGVLKCTNTHRLLSQGLWVSTEHLQPGDYLTLNGSQDFVLKKLLRAVVAVAKRLAQIPIIKLTEDI